MKLKDWISILAILALLGIGYYRFKHQEYSASRSAFLMDTLVEVRVRARDKEVNRHIDRVFALMGEYEAKFSYFDENSVLYQINTIEEEIALDSDFIEVLQLAERLYHASGGLYDVSIGQLIDLWDISTESVPSQAEIEFAQGKCGFDKVELTGDKLFVPADIKLNLGSLAKGFIVDKAMEYLIAQNVTEASVNAGGDIRFYSGGKRKWRIGIQHPREADELIDILNIPDMAVVTSGDYERAFEVGGVRYHHILNALTGYPASPTISVTIISPTALLADALSTAAFVMSPEAAIQLIKSYPQTEGIVYFIDSDGDIIALKTEKIREWE